MELPKYYVVCRHCDLKTRWMVTYKNDPYFFMVKSNLHGELIRGFKTKREAEQAVIDHEAYVQSLREQSRRAYAVSSEA